MEQSYKYIQLETAEVQYDQISIRILEDGTRYIRLNDEITAYLHAHKLGWVKLKVGESDKTVFLEFVENKDEYTAPIKDNSLVSLPSIIDNDVAETYIIALFDDVEDGFKINISENLTPWAPPVPVEKTVEATSEETVTEGVLLTFDAEELLGQKFKVNNTVVNASAKLVTTDIAGVETETALVLGENEIDLTDDDIEEYTLTLFNESGYEVEYTYTPAADPCVATYQIITETEE